MLRPPDRLVQVDPELARFGWDGRIYAFPGQTVVPDDTWPSLKAIDGYNSSSHYKALGLPEAILVTQPGARVLIRSGQYQWQQGGAMMTLEKESEVTGNELKQDPLLVPFPISVRLPLHSGQGCFCAVVMAVSTQQ